MSDKRKLQIIHDGRGCKLVDTETQQTIDGILELEINYVHEMTTATITILIDEPVLYMPDVVEGSVVPAYPQLPEGKE